MPRDRTKRCASARVFLITGVNHNDRISLGKDIQKLGAVYAKTEHFQSNATHVVCGKLSRSEKFLGALTLGRWVVQPQYVTSSMEAGRWLDEVDYEWSSLSAQGHDQLLATAAKRNRWRASTTTDKIFLDWHVAVVMSNASRQAVYKRLLVCGGAKVRDLKLPAKKPDECSEYLTYLFTDQAMAPLAQPLQDRGVMCLNADFISDTIIQHPSPDPLEYVLNSSSQTAGSQPAANMHDDSNSSDVLHHNRSNNDVFDINTAISTVTSTVSQSESHDQDMLVISQCAPLPKTTTAQDTSGDTSADNMFDFLDSIDRKYEDSDFLDSIDRKYEDRRGEQRATVYKTCAFTNDVPSRNLVEVSGRSNINCAGSDSDDIIVVTESSDDSTSDSAVQRRKRTFTLSQPIKTETVKTPEKKLRRVASFSFTRHPQWKASQGNGSVVKTGSEEDKDKNLNKSSSEGFTSSAVGLKCAKGSGRKRARDCSINVDDMKREMKQLKREVTKGSTNKSLVSPSPKRIQTSLRHWFSPTGKENNMEQKILAESGSKSEMEKTARHKTIRVNEILPRVNDRAKISQSVHSKAARSKSILNKNTQEHKTKMSCSAPNGRTKQNDVVSVFASCPVQKLSASLVTDSISKSESASHVSVCASVASEHGSNSLSHSKVLDHALSTSSCMGAVSNSASAVSSVLCSKTHSTNLEKTDKLVKSCYVAITKTSFVSSTSDCQNEIAEESVTVRANVQIQETVELSATHNTDVLISSVQHNSDSLHSQHAVKSENFLKHRTSDVRWHLSHVPLPKRFCLHRVNESSLKNLSSIAHVPDSLGHMISSCLDENYFQSAVAMATTAVSSCPSVDLFRQMVSVLTDSCSHSLMKQAHAVLMCWLDQFPPVTSALRNIYEEALGLNDWEKLRKLLENAVVEAEIQTDGTCQASQTHGGARMLLRIVLAALEKNFLRFAHSVSRQARSSCLMVRCLWSPSYQVYPNSRTRDLVHFLERALKHRYAAQACWSEMLGLVSMATQCCNLADNGWQWSADALMDRFTTPIVHDLTRAITGSGVDSLTGLQQVLSCLSPPWLLRQVVATLLNDYDDYLVPGGFSVDPVTFKTVVSKYFFLLPRLTAVNREAPKARRKCKKGREEDENKAPVPDNSLTAHKINKKNHKGETMLHRAAIKNNPSLLKQLLNVPGVDVNSQDYAGWTALHEACNHGHLECARALLKFVPSATLDSFFHSGKNGGRVRKVDLHLGNEEGITALHDAVMMNHVNVVKLLLKYGGSSLLEDKTVGGATAADLAITEEMRQMLTRDTMDLSLSQDSFSQEPDNGGRECVPSSFMYREVLDSGNGNAQISASLDEVRKFLALLTLLLRSHIQVQRQQQQLLQEQLQQQQSQQQQQQAQKQQLCTEDVAIYVGSLKRHVKKITTDDVFASVTVQLAVLETLLTQCC